MTIQELIDKLQAIEDKSLPVVIVEYWDGEPHDATDIDVVESTASAYDCNLKTMGEQGWYGSVPCVRLKT